MSKLDFPDRHFAQAAEGWLELGDPVEAGRELDRISPAAAGHPVVLELRWRLLARNRDWAQALEVARTMTSAAPDQAEGWIHQSYTLHELRRTDEAWSTLLSVAERFPTESIIPYNLACYACQLGDLTRARDWLQRAVRLRSKDEIRSLALTDPDLAPLRDYLQTL
ncbi:MAG TPA: tetratricopeptide repeat protein [Verrucomicrobiota bacterium]|nr:tetratricopeptide repeat protein [Verrucomicrobiota bacterium]